VIDETRYICPTCGEEIVIPVDPSEGTYQELVEDCPICCRPVVIRLEFVDEQTVRCEVEPESV
jgi:DNA replicative helicase MCM subunit Mcm2 (Cdc46/Mcm family)